MWRIPRSHFTACNKARALCPSLPKELMRNLPLSRTYSILPSSGVYNIRAAGGQPFATQKTGGARHVHSSDSAPPTQAEIVICGGGVTGSSVAYHLAKLGWKDVLLLEQGSLSGGTTWHAVGLLGQLRSIKEETQLSEYGCELYSKLEEETGLGTGFKRCGSLIVARTKERMSLLRRNADQARALNIDVEMVSPRQAEDLWRTFLRSDDIQGGVWIPEDGVANPTDVCQSLAKGAVQNGVRICEKVRVESIATVNGRVSGVHTDKGNIKCDIFVNCGGLFPVRSKIYPWVSEDVILVGLVLVKYSLENFCFRFSCMHTQWAREIGKKSSPEVNIPLHACEHFYVVTKPFGVPSGQPVLRDPDGKIYVREWSGGIMGGGFESNARPCFHEKTPADFEFQLFPEDWPHFEELLVELLHRIPALNNAEIRQMVNGPESFTPDMTFCLGPVPEVKNYYVAAGMNSSGIAKAAGVGRALSEWITAGEPPVDLSPFDIRRFSRDHNNKMFLRDRVKETLGEHYAMRFPYSERKTARNVKCSALHCRLDAAGAVWGEKNGWERANWFQVPGEARPRDHGFGKPDWFDNVQAEYTAGQHAVGLVDVTSLGGLEICSPTPSACQDLLQFLCAKDISHVTSATGHVVETAMLNNRGGFEAVCSVLATDKHKFLLLLPTAEHTTAVQSWVARHSPEQSDIQIRNVQSSYVSLGLLGPMSSRLLQRLTQTPLDEESFPFETYKEIDMGYAVGVKLVRKSDHLDVLKWQLLVPVEYALNLYDQLMNAGGDLGITNVGHLSLKCARVQQGRPMYGAELTPHTNIRDIRLSCALDTDKKADFLGKQAVLEMDNAPRQNRLVHVSMMRHDKDELPWGGELIVLDGEVVGAATSVSYSFELDQPVCLGFVKQDEKLNEALTEDGRLEIVVAGETFPIKLRLLDS